MEEEQWTKTKPIYVKVSLFRKLLLGFVTIKQTYDREKYFTRWYPKCIIKADYLPQTPSSKKKTTHNSSLKKSTKSIKK